MFKYADAVCFGLYSGSQKETLMKKQSIMVLCGFVILAVTATTLVGLLTWLVVSHMAA